MRTQVAFGATASVLAPYPDPLALLTEQERTRAAAFKFDTHRNDFIAAHVLVRRCAADALDTAPEEITIVQYCPTCAGPHGPPRVAQAPQLAVSLSHTRGHVAASAGPGPSGVDLERTDRVQAENLLDSVLAPAEAEWVRAADSMELAFLDLWVRKEALIKAGYASLGRLAVIDLVGGGSGPVDRWQDLHLTGWYDSRGACIGACAAPDPATIRNLPAAPPRRADHGLK